MKKNNNADTLEFDWFEDRGARITDSFITISENGTVLFSSGFIHEADISGKTYVRFGYNKEGELIAFDFTKDKKATGVYTVVLRGEKAKSGSVTSRAFFKKYNLVPEKIAGRYSPEIKKVPRRGQFWIIDLNEKIEK